MLNIDKNHNLKTNENYSYDDNILTDFNVFKRKVDNVITSFKSSKTICYKKLHNVLSEAYPDYQIEILKVLYDTLKEANFQGVQIKKDLVYFKYKTTNLDANNKARYGFIQLCKINVEKILKELHLIKFSDISKYSLEVVLQPKFLIPTGDRFINENLRDFILYDREYSPEIYEKELQDNYLYKYALELIPNVEEQASKITRARERNALLKKLNKHNELVLLRQKVISLVYKVTKELLGTIKDYMLQNDFANRRLQEGKECKSIFAIVLVNFLDQRKELKVLKEELIKRGYEKTYWTLLDLTALCFIGRNQVGSKLEVLSDKYYTVSKTKFNSNTWTQLASDLNEALKNFDIDNCILSTLCRLLHLGVMENNSPFRIVAMDSVVMKSTSKNIFEVIDAFDTTNNTSIKGYKMTVVHDLDSYFPIHASLRRGNIIDNSIGIPVLDSFKEYGFDKLIILNDKGFTKKDYLSYLIQNDIHYCVMGKTIAGLKNLIKEHSARFTGYFLKGICIDSLDKKNLASLTLAVSPKDLDLELYQEVYNNIYGEVEKVASEEEIKKFKEKNFYITLFSNLDQTAIAKKKDKIVMKLADALYRGDYSDLTAKELSYIKSNRDLKNNLPSDSMETEMERKFYQAIQEDSESEDFSKQLHKKLNPPAQPYNSENTNEEVRDKVKLTPEILKQIKFDKIGYDLLVEDVNVIVSSFPGMFSEDVISLYRLRAVIECVFKNVQSGQNNHSGRAHAGKSLRLRMFCSLFADTLSRLVNVQIPNIITSKNFKANQAIKKIDSSYKLEAFAENLQIVFDPETKRFNNFIRDSYMKDLTKLFVSNVNDSTDNISLLNLLKTYLEKY